MMKSVVIFGSGYHSKVILSEISKIKNYKALGFIDEKLKPGTTIKEINNKKYKVLTNIKGLRKILKKNTYGIIGIGTNSTRKKVYLQVSNDCKNLKWATIISKNAVINEGVTIGAGTFIVSNATINTGTIIGNHCLINTSSSIDHDNRFDNFSSSGPGAVTGGNVTVGECSHIGIGAIVKQNVRIGKNTVVGANSLVLKNCDNNSLYFGSPSKKISKRKFDQKYL
jgi:sugar O-acyltransferase (sialic acid O-acetyltransferase NeuD family)